MVFYNILTFFKEAKRRNCSLYLWKEDVEECIKFARWAVKIGAKKYPSAEALYWRLAIRHSWGILPKEKILVLFNIYFPNGGANQERYNFKLKFYDFFLEYLKAYEEEYPNIAVTGDYNTAHHAIDLARPKDNEQTSGFIREERDY